MAKTTLKSKKEPSGVRDYIIKYYNDYLNRKPDVTEIKKLATLLKSVMQSDEEDVRLYTLGEVSVVYKYLFDNGACMDQVEMIKKPGLLSCVIDNKPGLARGILEDILKYQETLGLGTNQSLNRNKPIGW